ncbi:hypothetical protein [Haliangium sp.]|uniref:hypothetical protein n=1 Tax=Haliangium sp. TaxID=2663208 RepID=UPI003D0AF382
MGTENDHRIDHIGSKRTEKRPSVSIFGSFRTETGRDRRSAVPLELKPAAIDDLRFHLELKPAAIDDLRFHWN